MNTGIESSGSGRSDSVPADVRDERIRRGLLVAGLLTIITASWAYLGYQDWAMRHMDLVAMAMPAAGSWSSADFVLVFTMWAVMMVAMMLPSAIPTLRVYRAVALTRGEKASAERLTAMFAVGYVSTWTLFSGAATLSQWVLHAFAWVSPSMRASGPIAGVLLVAAGVYQWTPLKRACLARCAWPLQFLPRHWRSGAVGAWQMGVLHGAYCAGCCWLLMGLLFVFGMMNLAWIVVIAAYVLAEKLLPRQRWLSKLAGALLVLWGGSVLLIALR